MKKVMSKETYDYIVNNIHRLKSYNLESGFVETVKGSNGAIRGGYLAVKLGEKVINVHQIISVLAFGEECIGKQINHRDGNKLNNKPSNLEVCTQLDNIRHQHKNGLHGDYGRKPVNKLSLDGEFIERYESIKEALESLGKGIDKVPMISAVCRGKRKTTYGYRWEYAD